VLSEREAEVLEAYVTDLAETTYALADGLVELGNDREVDIGRRIETAMRGIEKAESQDGMVRALDNLVDALDAATNYCDEN